MEQQEKIARLKRALTEGIIDDPQWLEKPDEPVPAWFVADLLIKLLEKLDPPYKTYD